MQYLTNRIGNLIGLLIERFKKWTLYRYMDHIEEIGFDKRRTDTEPTMVTEHNACYGNMFPDLSSGLFSENQDGSAFRFEVKPLKLSSQQKLVAADIEMPDFCCACSVFDTDYWLPKHILALQPATNGA
jgi:hypothetical protein